MNLESTTADAIADLRRDYLTTLTAPQDAYWQEGLIPAADHFGIHIDDQRVGYVAIDGDNQLLQFHLIGEYHRQAPQLLKQVIEQRKIKTALVATIEPFTLGLCLDLHTSAKVHTYLFVDHQPVTPTMVGHNPTLRKATMADLVTVLTHFMGGDEAVDVDTIDANHGGMAGYARMVIDAGILHILEQEGRLLGTGEFRVRQEWPGYVDLGVITHKDHRRKGVGAYILAMLKQKAVAQGLTAICSCEAWNEASRNTVEKAGFIARNRVVAFGF